LQLIKWFNKPILIISNSTWIWFWSIENFQIYSLWNTHHQHRLSIVQFSVHHGSDTNYYLHCLSLSFDFSNICQFWYTRHGVATSNYTKPYATYKSDFLYLTLWNVIILILKLAWWDPHSRKLFSFLSESFSSCCFKQELLIHIMYCIWWLRWFDNNIFYCIDWVWVENKVKFSSFGSSFWGTWSSSSLC
jgi:hypothetical protein